MENVVNNFFQNHSNFTTLLNNFVDQAFDLVVTASIEENSTKELEIDVNDLSEWKRENHLGQEESLEIDQSLLSGKVKIVNFEELEQNIVQETLEKEIFCGGSDIVTDSIKIPSPLEQHIDHNSICKTISEIKENTNTMADPSTTNFTSNFPIDIQSSISNNIQNNSDSQSYSWQGSQMKEFSQSQNSDSQTELDYGNTSFENGYLQGLLPDNQYNYTRGEQIHQILNPDFSSHLLAEQELPPITSAYNKVGSFHQNTAYCTTNKIQNSSYYDNLNESSKKMSDKPLSESGSEEVEDRSREKKLTTTPIPSDAEKTSSGSSMSSGSCEESTSSDSNFKSPADSNFINSNNKVVEVTANTVEVGENLEFNASLIPVSPVSQVNFDKPSTSKVGKTWSSDMSEVASDRKALGKQSTWSVQKEERRKKRHKKKVIRNSYNENLFENFSKDLRNKHGTRDTSHHENIIRSQSTEIKSYSSYSGLLPKTTADPTSFNPILPRPKSFEKNKTLSRKEKSEKKLSNKIKKKACDIETFQHNLNCTASQIKSTLDKDNSRRWQTVTAIQGPKLPPMLSERDRIPKRGRPSKKMTEFNLKFKPDEDSKKVVQNSKSIDMVPGASSLVAMYTINDKGCIEQLGNKPKENRRSKERAEAFRNMLSEISKKTSIQNKTANAKEVVGAFKAVGVRTRKQVSTISNGTFDKKKNKKKVFVGGETTISDLYPKREIVKPHALEEDRIYTFSELAKQYKISNSILYRAMEQSQRNLLNKGRNSKHKSREKGSKLSEKEILSYKPKSEIPELKESFKAENADIINFHNKNLTNHKDAIPRSFKSEVKRRKRKKKQKKKRDKDKDQSVDRKRSKDKKKKSKRKEKGEKKGNVIYYDAADKFESSKLQKVEKSNKKLLKTGVGIDESFSSVSGCDEAYDGGDSSSDQDLAPKTYFKQVMKTSSISKIIFGGNAVLPSFQGIKEHGGLIQFSEHNKKLTELNNRQKKQKHKRKKNLNKSKNIEDPKFVNQLNELVDKMKMVKIATDPTFLSSSFLKQRSNVFVANSKSSIFSVNSLSSINLYREPSKDNSNRFSSTVVNNNNLSQIRNMSSYCTSPFFVKYGLIKPYSQGNNNSATMFPATKYSSQVNTDKDIFNSHLSSSTMSNQNNLFVNSNSIQTKKESDSDNQMMSKKKRGWPLGKPRGSRTKKVFYDRNESDCESDTSTAELKKSKKNDDNNLPSNSGLGTPSATDESTSTSFNHDLVDHIKAAITAKLDAGVSTDVVTKTVDAAVANYFQKVTPVADKILPVENKEIHYEPPIKRARGRPSKNFKISKKYKGDIAKISLTRPGKASEFKHENAVKPTSLKQNKRGPGRPRKHSKGKLKSQILCKRALAAFVPSSAHNKKQLHKTKKSERTSLISNNRIKEALEALVTTTALDKHLQSTKWLAQVNQPEPSMYYGTEVDLHINEAIESTIKSAALSDRNLSLKKNLEFVVAKLKSKQIQPNNNATVFCSKSIDQVMTTTVDENKNVVKSLRKQSQICQQNFDKINSQISKTASAVADKEYQKAGFFCEEYKISKLPMIVSTKNCSISDSGDNDIEEKHVFQLPRYPTEFLFETQDFQLPWEIWCSFQNNSLSPNQEFTTCFVKINENVYSNSLPADEDIKTKICDCNKEEKSCQINCLNRLDVKDCSPKPCLVGHSCKNQVIENKEWCKDLEQFKTDDKGWGIRSKTCLNKGSFILEYVGEILNLQEFQRRYIQCYRYYSNHYYIKLSENVVIDAYSQGNEGRFVNHSCNPNCEIQIWKVLGQNRACLFTKKIIRPGEELTFDYNLHTLINQSLQQICRCKSSNCRGYFGINSQLFYNEPNLKRTKQISQTTPKNSTSISDSNVQFGIEEINANNIPDISKPDQILIKAKKIFLIRNLNKVRYCQDQQNQQQTTQNLKIHNENLQITKDSKVVDDVIKEVFTAVMSCKDEIGISLSIPFINLPSKLQNPEMFENINEAVDLSCVERKILNDKYKDIDDFCSDMLSVFRHAEKYHGRKSTLGKDVSRLRRAFTNAKHSMSHLLLDDNHKNKEVELMEIERRKNGDYIRCICGIYKDEGVMIQCEKCFVWQHCDCMDVEANNYNDLTPYFCEECDEREVPVEVEVVPQPPSAPPGHTYYLTLLKDKMLVKQGDCVRLIHDHRLRQRSSTNPPVRASYRIQSHLTPDSHDFFRIIKLWTDDSGDKYAFGHHFLRPHDTKHSDNTLFYFNELVATPFHEIVPLEAVISTICVMDFATFTKGRLKGVKECDVYICEHKVDLDLRLLHKPVNLKYQICTKPHVFDEFSQTDIPHRNTKVPQQYKKNQLKRTQWLRFIDHGDKSDEDGCVETECESAINNDNYSSPSDTEQCDVTGDEGTNNANSQEMSINDVINENGVDSETGRGRPPNEKKRRLSGILNKLVKDANTRQKRED